MDILFQVAYGQDLSRIHELLDETARVNPWSLDEPPPVIIFNDFKDPGIEVLFGMWFTQSDFLQLKNSIMKDITTRFAAEDIRFASPNRVIRVVEGSLTS
jgi:small-conductance mechanosensitive channel